MDRALPIIFVLLLLGAGMLFLVSAPDSPGRLDRPPQVLGKSGEFAHDREAAALACEAAWRGSGFQSDAGPLQPQGGGPVAGRDLTYGCVGLVGGEPVYLVARYAGGPETEPASWRVDAICDADGRSLIAAGGRTPELCAVSPIRKAIPAAIQHP
ncbi:MAG: hypothetical protein AAFX09_03550 [Pseudomonadota bacterium]